jgi:hypothetical protein
MDDLHECSHHTRHLASHPSNSYCLSFVAHITGGGSHVSNHLEGITPPKTLGI